MGPLFLAAYFGFALYFWRQDFAPAGRAASRAFDRDFQLEASGRRLRFWISYYRQIPQNRQIPQTLFGAVEFPAQGRFELLAERIAERLAKALGMATEVQTGFASFDERCFLITDHPDFTRAMFRDRARREAALRLFDRGARNVMLADGVLTVAFRLPGDEVDAQAMSHDVASDLAALAVLPAPALSLRDRALAVRGHATWLAAHSLGVATLLWWILARLDPHSYWVLEFAADERRFPWAIIGVAVLAIAVLAALLLRGHAAALREIAFIAMFALLILLHGAEDMIAWLNGRFDRAPASSHRIAVLQEDRRGPSLHVESWRQGHKRERVPVSGADYQTAEPGHDKLLVTTRPGLLGLEWVVETRLEPGATAHQPPPDIEAELRHAIALQPLDFDARRRLDDVLARQQRWPEVVQIWDEFLIFEPGHASAYLERAGAHHHAGNRAASLRDLQRACALGEQKACGLHQSESRR